MPHARDCLTEVVRRFRDNQFLAPRALALLALLDEPARTSVTVRRSRVDQTLAGAPVYESTSHHCPLCGSFPQPSSWALDYPMTALATCVTTVRRCPGQRVAWMWIRTVHAGRCTWNAALVAVGADTTTPTWHVQAHRWAVGSTATVCGWRRGEERARRKRRASLFCTGSVPFIFGRGVGDFPRYDAYHAPPALRHVL